MAIFGFGKQKKEKEYLLQWQNTIISEPINKLVLSKEELEAQTRELASNDIRIIEDSLAIVQKTLNPDVFFTRMNLLIDVSTRLKKYEPYLPRARTTPSELNLHLKEQYQSVVRRFLLRYYSDTRDKINALKTDKGKLARWKNWYDSLRDYYEYMDEENIHLIEADYRINTREKE
ncbi:MAG: hypothetical protein J6M47_04390 [Clostridia bacterium]|nr:hypothetical protein [Clostridia bacterium]